MSQKDEKASNGVVIRDCASRRTFMRRGAALVAVAGAVSTSSMRSALAADCDRGGPGGEKSKQAGNGSDADTGASADPTGCGRRQDQPKISQAPAVSEPGLIQRVSVATVKT